MSATWFNIYLPLWVSRDMTVEQLNKAKEKRRITQDEYDTIISTPQNPV
jgi:hypothetical protein